MLRSFRSLIRDSMGPRWLVANGESGLISESLGWMIDAFLERALLGLLVRFPQQGPDGTAAPVDALAEMGRDRRVVRGLEETDAAFAVRLLAWLDDRRTGGNAFALMQKIREYVGVDCVIKTVDAQGNWYVRGSDGTRTFYVNQQNWEWDDHPEADGLRRWSRFWVIIHPPAALWTAFPNYGAGETFGEASSTWGTTATSEEVKTLRSIVRDWKPAHSRCANIIIAFDPASFDPTAAVDAAGMPNYLWEHWSKNVNGVQVPTRLSTARYWDGTS